MPTLPKSLADQCTQWKRIPDLYAKNGGGSMIVESESAPISLLQSNTHLFTSPYIRYIIGQLSSLQAFCLETDDQFDWRPWHQIYALNKAGGKEHKPLVNPAGKYAVKVFWVGKWRKVIIDDAMPCTEEGLCLLPLSSNQNEIWPLILFKALLKLTALSLSPRSPELPESELVTALTGWLPEYLSDCVSTSWDLLTTHLPMWTRPEAPPATPAQNATKEDEKKKKDKKKKDEKTDEKDTQQHPLLCLTKIELAEADSHPAWLIQTRDKSLREPSPPPNIPRWKLVRPQPDVIQLLDNIEKRKIPNQWCQVRSPFRISTEGESDLDINEENGDDGKTASTATDLSTTVHERSDESEWVRIEELCHQPKTIVIFHRPSNPAYRHCAEYMAAVRENFKAQSYKYLLFDSRRDETRLVVNFNIQNKKNDWPSLNMRSEPSELRVDEALDSGVRVNANGQHERDLAEAESSTLHIQNYSLTQYIQNPDDIFKLDTYGQGSISFTLPRGRSVLRFAVGCRYISNVEILVAQTEDLFKFGNLDVIIPVAAELPYSWESFGHNLIEAVRNIVDSLGDSEKVRDAFRQLSAVLVTSDRKDMWHRFRCAFYRLASDTLGEGAIPEDLGALRLIFHDCVPSPGPQPFFSQVKTGFTISKEDEEEVADISNHLQGISGEHILSTFESFTYR